MSVIHINVVTEETGASSFVAFYDDDTFEYVENFTVRQGDRVDFHYYGVIGAVQSVLIDVSTVVFDPFVSQALNTVGQTVSFYVAMDSVLGAGIAIKASYTGFAYTEVLGTLNVLVWADTNPDPMIVPDIVSAQPSNNYYSPVLTVTGIAIPVTVSIPSTYGAIIVNGGGFSYADQVVNEGDTVQFIITSGNYGETRTSDLYIGDWYNLWSLTTGVDPTIPVALPMPYSAPKIHLSEIHSFFGGTGYLSQYLKGGAYVPDIASNAAIPTTPPLSMSKFVGSGSEIQFTTPPSAKVATDFVGIMPVTLKVRWDLDTDFFIGLGDSADYQIRYSIVNPSGFGETLDCAAVGNWSVTNTWVEVSEYFNGTTSKYVVGNVLIEVRHKDQIGYVITAQPNYILSTDY